MTSFARSRNHIWFRHPMTVIDCPISFCRPGVDGRLWRTFSSILWFDANDELIGLLGCRFAERSKFARIGSGNQIGAVIFDSQSVDYFGLGENHTKAVGTRYQSSDGKSRLASMIEPVPLSWWQTFRCSVVTTRYNNVSGYAKICVILCRPLRQRD